MVSINTSVEALLLEEKKYTVKGYSFYDDLSPKKLTNEKIAQYLLDRFYICPVCNKIQRGWALYEEKVDGIVLRKFFFTCKHYVTSIVGLQVVDMEYKDMFVIWLHIITLTEIQLIQRSDSIIYPFMYWISTWNATSGSAPSGQPLYLFPTFVINTAGTNISNVEGFTVAAGSGNTNFGIVVGSGTNANTTSTYALQTPIANGTSAGQLQYGSTGVSSPGISGNTVTVTINRALTNSSGGTITITEVALYAQFFYVTSTPSVATGYFAITRDVLATAISLANGASTTIYYNLQVTIS